MPTTSSIARHRWLVVYIVVYALIHSIGLDRSPLIWLDEVTLNDPARILAEQGRLRSSVFEDIPTFRDHYYWQPPVQALSTAAVYKLFGFGIWQTRFPVLLFGCLSLVGIYGIIYLLCAHRGSALVGAMLWSVDPLFTYAARNARMDTESLALGAFATLVFLVWNKRSEQTRSLSLLGLSGACASLACLTHPVAVGISAGLILNICIAKPFRLRNLAAFVVGMSVVGIPWLGWILLDGGWTDFTRQFIRHGSDHVSGLSLPMKFLSELQRYPRDYFHSMIVLVLFVVVAVALFFPKILQTKDFQISPTALRVMVLSTFAFNVVVMTKEVGFYSLYPGLFLYVACGLCYFILAKHSRWPLLPGVVAALIVACWFTLGLGARVYLLTQQWQSRDPQFMKTELSRLQHPASIYGEAAVWYAAVELNDTLSVEDTYTTLAYPERQSHDYRRFRYFILEKRLQLAADKDSCTVIGRILRTAPNIFHSDLQDTLYNFDILESRHFTSH